MSWIDLRTGYRCNNQCRFCDQAGRTGEASFDAIVAALRGASMREGVWLAGGEITLRPDLPRLITAAREAGFRRIGLQTNGRVLSAAGAAASLRRVGLTDVVVAIHGATAELHDFLTRQEGSFRQAILGVRRSREAGLAVRLSSVITRSSTDALPAVARLAVELGVEGHRWHVCRPGTEADRMLVPRFAQLARPLGEALTTERDARIEADTVGVPLCHLPGHLAAAADREDSAGVTRMFPPGLEEEPPVRRRGPPCVTCRLAGVCQGPPAAYVEQWGWDEFVPVAGAAQGAKGATLFFPVVAPCSRGCQGCGSRGAFGTDWPTETTRALRQRLVRAAGEGASTLIFAGASPWDHPALPAMVREAARLSFARIEVWGPIHPLRELDVATAEKLAGLARVLVPRLSDAVAGPGTGAEQAAGAERLATLLPACVVDWIDSLPAAGPLYRADGPAAVWAGCGVTGAPAGNRGSPPG